MSETPQCFRCKHLVDLPSGFTCPAFEGEIPDAIVFNKHDHRQPYNGDRGIRFEPKPTGGADDPLNDATSEGRS